jgi:hypothetical protein
MPTSSNKRTDHTRPMDGGRDGWTLWDAQIDRPHLPRPASGAQAMQSTLIAFTDTYMMAISSAFQMKLNLVLIHQQFNSKYLNSYNRNITECTIITCNWLQPANNTSCTGSPCIHLTTSDWLLCQVQAVGNSNHIPGYVLRRAQFMAWILIIYDCMIYNFY